MWCCALCDRTCRCQKTAAEGTGDLVVIGDLGRVHCLHVASGPDLFTDEVLDVCNVKAVGLCSCALCHAVRVKCSHFKRKAKVFLHFVGDIIKV